VNDPVGDIVPINSIEDPVPFPPLRKRSAAPVLSDTEPLSGKLDVAGVRQKLDAPLTVPSVRTFTVAVNTVPSGIDPPVHGNVVLWLTVNDQLPETSAAVTGLPAPPPVPKKGSVLVSQAAVRTSKVRARAVGLT
jgi:hypothetical protein